VSQSSGKRLTYAGLTGKVLTSGIIGAIQGEQGFNLPELRQKIRSQFARSTHVSGQIDKVALYQGSSRPDKEILQANTDEAAAAPDDEQPGNSNPRQHFIFTICAQCT
jgi:hypothetical protein